MTLHARACVCVRVCSGSACMHACVHTGFQLEFVNVPRGKHHSYLSRRALPLLTLTVSVLNGGADSQEHLLSVLYRSLALWPSLLLSPLLLFRHQRRDSSMWERLILARGGPGGKEPLPRESCQPFPFKPTVPQPWKQMSSLDLVSSSSSFIVWFDSSWVERQMTSLKD